MTDLSTPIAGAGASAYKAGRTLPVQPEAFLGDEAFGKPSGASFGDMVRENLAGAVDTLRTGERIGQQGLSGQVDVQTVVEATMAMERTVQTVTPVRDKIVSAYQEVLRMPV